MLNVQLSENNKIVKPFPTVSHYLMFRFINNIVNNFEKSVQKINYLERT